MQFKQSSFNFFVTPLASQCCLFSSSVLAQQRLKLRYNQASLSLGTSLSQPSIISYNIWKHIFKYAQKLLISKFLWEKL